jgi:hypothetical protein
MDRLNRRARILRACVRDVHIAALDPSIDEGCVQHVSSNVDALMHDVRNACA